MDNKEVRNIIIKLLKDNSIGKNTAVLTNLDMGLYIWRKNIYVLKDFNDIEFEELSELEQNQVFYEVQNGNFTINNTYQG